MVKKKQTKKKHANKVNKATVIKRLFPGRDFNHELTKTSSLILHKLTRHGEIIIVKHSTLSQIAYLLLLYLLCGKVMVTFGTDKNNTILNVF